MWIGINGVEDISYGYDTNTVGVDAPPGTGLTVGAESINGTAGAQIVGPPASSYVVTSTPGTPGGSAAVTLSVRGKDDGTGKLTSSMVTNVIAGTTIVVRRSTSQTLVDAKQPSDDTVDGFGADPRFYDEAMLRRASSLVAMSAAV